MTENERHIEAAQTLQHLHDIADLLAERMRALPANEADELLEAQLVALAMLSKQQERRSDASELASEVGFRMRAVIRERVAEQLGNDGEA